MSNLFNEKNNGDSLLKLIEKNLVLSSHDISNGGLITALAEMAINSEYGAKIQKPKKLTNAAKIIDLEDIWAPRNINRTMSNSSWESKFGLLQGKPKYDNVGKLFVLKKYFGKSIMMDAKKPVAVTSYDIEKRKPVLIRSYSEADSKIKIIAINESFQFCKNMTVNRPIKVKLSLKRLRIPLLNKLVI